MHRAHPLALLAAPRRVPQPRHTVPRVRSLRQSEKSPQNVGAFVRTVGVRSQQLAHLGHLRLDGPPIQLFGRSYGRPHNRAAVAAESQHGGVLVGGAAAVEGHPGAEYPRPASVASRGLALGGHLLDLRTRELGLSTGTRRLEADSRDGPRGGSPAPVRRAVASAARAQGRPRAGDDRCAPQTCLRACAAPLSCWRTLRDCRSRRVSRVGSKHGHPPWRRAFPRNIWPSTFRAVSRRALASAGQCSSR